MFYTWLQVDASSEGNAPARGRILLPDEISLKVSTDNYLGGLCNLTGRPFTTRRVSNCTLSPTNQSQ